MIKNQWKGVALAGLLSCIMGTGLVVKAADATPDEIPFKEGETPPPPGDGWAWCLVTKPAVIKTVQEQIQIRPATFFYETVPAVLAEKEEKVLVEPAKKIVVTVPATFKTQKITKVVAPEKTELQVVPAQYEWVEEEIPATGAYSEKTVQSATYEAKTEQVLLVPEHTEWKRIDCGDIHNVIRRESKDECYTLVKIPAKYGTVTKQSLAADNKVGERAVAATTRKIKVQKLVKEAEVKKVTVPAVTETYEETVVDVPASTREETIPERWETIKKMVVVSPESKKKVDVPAKFEVVNKEVLESPATLVWRKGKAPSPKKYPSVPGASPEALR